MKKVMIVVLLAACSAGCSSLRLAPTETQKRNAWSHMQTTGAMAVTARDEECSAKVCTLANLSARQAEAFAADYGMPEKLPQGATVEDILAEANWRTADEAIIDSQRRPDGWVVADGILEFGAGLAGLFGGVYGARVLRFVDEARTKTKALKEIVEGNELFKKRNPTVASDFKEAHSSQSQETRGLVASLK
jgi:cytochrome c556